MFDLQGHRGARGLKPENTLPSFEVAFDLGVSSIETDVRLTSDKVAVLFHDPIVQPRLCRIRAGSAALDPVNRFLVSSLTLEQLQGYIADRNPDPGRFPEQDPSVTPLAELFARKHGIHPYAPPALWQLFAFAQAYLGESGRLAGKTEPQQAKVRQLRFDLELKRVPFRPEENGDQFDGADSGKLEEKVLAAVRRAQCENRTTVRSFDHRSVRVMRRMEPRLTGAVLLSGMTALSAATVAHAADARIYCPEYEFVNQALVSELHLHGKSVLPWTVNAPDDWERLLGWQVDGITTDFPDRLAELLKRRGIDF